MSDSKTNFEEDFDGYFNYDISYEERKKHQKQFRITQKQLLSKYPEVFKKINAGKSKQIIKLDDSEAKEILKEYYIPFLIKDNKLRIHSIKSNRKLANGEVKEYDVKLFYKPHDKPSKFEVLLEDEFIERTINDPNIELVDKVYEIYNYILEIMNESEIDESFKEWSVINNWVRRYWRKKKTF